MAKRYPFKISDESVNTYKFRMLTEGGNLEEYIKNPVVLLNHNDYGLPIGKGYNIRKEGAEIWLDIEFDSEHDDEARKVEGKVERDMVRMCSIGAWEPEEISDDPALKLPGQSGPTVTKWTLREVSICTIGSNHNALAMYDRKTQQRINLLDESRLLNLFDATKGIKSHENNKNMKLLTNLLKLSDSASEEAIHAAVQTVLNMNDQLKGENQTLKTDKTALAAKVEGFESKEKAVQKAETITLLDAAVKAGTINQDGRASWDADFEKDFAGAKVRLSSIPARASVASAVQAGKSTAGIQLSDMSFADIVKADRLKELKKDAELYRQKFYDAHGKYPA